MPEYWPLDQIVDPEDAQKIARKNVCPACWGELVVSYDWHTRTTRVTCSTPGCTFPGLVSKSWVEKQEAKSAGDLANARYALGSAGVLPRRSEKDIMKDLGF